MKVTIKETREADVVYLQADCGVRYWEDAHVNGVEDAEGTLIPCRVEDRWKPVIDLEAGKIEGWAQGTEARLHYKVCDDGVYTLLDADRRPVKEFDGYVPKMMCPAGAGFGDYVIMNIGPDGTIENWHADLTPFMAVTT